MKFTYLFLTISLIIPLNFINGQDYGCLDLPVFEGQNLLTNAFAGGYDAPQFNQMDIDLDGFEDLIIYDRASQDIRVHIYENGTYKLDCHYSSIFPFVSSWIRMVDYDHDGIKDLFLSPEEPSKPSIEVWKGSVREDQLQFDQMYFPYGNQDVISYDYFGNYYAVYVAKPDLPALIDIDKDGDLDVLSFESGGGTINYYKNVCIEEGLALDSFKMKLSDRCWGKFRESLYSEEIILSDDPTDCASSGGFRHAGSTLTIFDRENDDDFDLLLGDADYPGLIFLQNEGGEVDWMTYQERDYPQNGVPVDLNWFLGTFLIDMDQDGQQELLIAPNTKIGSENKSNILVYSDEDTSEAFEFAFDGEILSNESIDWGSDVYPTFIDYNQDGLLDFVLGSKGYYNEEGDFVSHLVLYENTGSPENPSFQLKDSDFAHTKAWSRTCLCPSFGDLDDDGDLDLLIGMGNGTLTYLENITDDSGELKYASPIHYYMDIDVGNNAYPFLYDLNDDGRLDILCGNEKSFKVENEVGSLALFQNEGNVNVASFASNLDDPANVVPWGGIAKHKNNFNLESRVRPWITKTKDATYLFIGSVNGSVDHYEINNGVPQLLEDTLGQIYFGEFATPSLADLDHDGYLEMLIGLESGGLRCYTTPLESGTTNTNTMISEDRNYWLNPNPAHDWFSINSATPDNFSVLSIKVFNELGQMIFTNEISSSSQKIHIGYLQKGVYYIQLHYQSGSKIEKLIIH